MKLNRLPCFSIAQGCIWSYSEIFEEKKNSKLNKMIISKKKKMKSP